MPDTRSTLSVGLVLGLALAASLGTARARDSKAQPAPPAAPAAQTPPQAAAPSTGSPERDTLLRMTRRVTLDLQEQRLGDVVTFLQDFTGADLEPAWRTDTQEGLDPDARITLRVTNLPALAFLERVLQKLDSGFERNAWQMTPYGALEFGPKQRLNASRRLVIYDIADLMLELPNFYDAPEIDLQSVLQGTEGGGGGQSPFRDDEQERLTPEEQEQRRQDRIDRLVELLTSQVEPDQWIDNGGDAASVRVFQNSLLINAPDYVHRQIGGYAYWPSRTAQSAQGGRRYVTLNMDASNSTVDFVAEREIGGVTGGGGGGSPPPGGGG